MTLQTFSRRQLRGFSDFSADFSIDQSLFNQFLSIPFEKPDDITRQILLKERSYSDSFRSTLVRVLERQLGDRLSESQKKNLEALRSDRTFTITTGHQLTLFGGPLFLVYKVLHVVRLTEIYNNLQSEYRTVPVFWLASEDHDVEEIRSASVFNREISWNTSQTGAVGRFTLDDFDGVRNEVRELFAARGENEFVSVLDSITAENYETWYQRFASELFGRYGVLVLQPDDKELKTEFLPVMRQEILEGEPYVAVQRTNQALESSGLKPQAAARNCNLFFLEKNDRVRIETEGAGFKIGNSRFSKSELHELLNREPENFSPNVILRPVYQETILPNVCYVGGGGEMAYWIQLKGVFEIFSVPFPLLQQRVSLMLEDAGVRKKMDKTAFEPTFYFQLPEQMKQTYLIHHSEEELDTSSIDRSFEELRTAMIEKCRFIDPGQISAAEAECARIEKQIDTFKQKLRKQIRQQHDQALKNLEFISQKFYPDGELQERALHWLNFVPDGNFQRLFQQIYEAIDPFEGALIYLEV